MSAPQLSVSGTVARSLPAAAREPREISPVTGKRWDGRRRRWLRRRIRIQATRRRRTSDVADGKVVAHALAEPDEISANNANSHDLTQRKNYTSKELIP